MRVAFLAIEEATQTERRGERAIDRTVEQQVAGLIGAELAIGFGLLGQLAFDALEIVGIWIDLALVLQGDVLCAVFAGLDLEAERAASDIHLLLAGLDRERDAEDGDPALAVFADYQCGLVLIAHRRRGRAAAQIDHRHTARHGLVQQAGNETLGMDGKGERE